MKTSILILALTLTSCSMLPQLKSAIEVEAQANDELNRGAVEAARYMLCDRLSLKIYREEFPETKDKQDHAQFCDHEIIGGEIPVKE